MPKQIKIPLESGKTSFRFPKELLKRLRVHCAEKTVQQSDVVTVAVAEYLNRRGLTGTEKPAPQLQLGPSEVTVPQSEQAHPIRTETASKGTVSNSTLNSSITESEQLWVAKLLRILRSGEYPNLADAITKNLDGFEFALCAAEEAAELRVQLERAGVTDADEGDSLKERAAGLRDNLQHARSLFEGTEDVAGDVRKNEK